MYAFRKHVLDSVRKSGHPPLLFLSMIRACVICCATYMLIFARLTRAGYIFALFRAHTLISTAVLATTLDALLFTIIFHQVTN